MAVRPPFILGGIRVAAGSRVTVDLPVSVLSDHTPVTMSVHVIHGSKPGPTAFVSAAIHGDEVVGVEIVRRLLRVGKLDHLRGTLLAVPIVNAFGFLNHSRYLPDRRDLNRTFPGSAHGSLAGRLAHLFLNEIVIRCDIGIDLHSAAIHRTNLPQIRVTPGNAKALRLAYAFGAPLVLTSKPREGSLRAAAAARDVDILLYEAGEGLRFDELAAQTGLSGILRVLRALGMVSGKGAVRRRIGTSLSTSSSWQRSPAGGLLRAFKSVGDDVAEGDCLGMVSDPFGELEIEVVADRSGVVIGRTNLPIVNEGDGLFHIARIDQKFDSDQAIELLAEQLDADALFDEDEII